MEINNYLWKSAMQRRTGGCIEQFHIPRLWYQLCLRKTDNKNTFAPSFPNKSMWISTWFHTTNIYRFLLSRSLTLFTFKFPFSMQFSLCLFFTTQFFEYRYILFAQGKSFSYLNHFSHQFSSVFYLSFYYFPERFVISTSMFQFWHICTWINWNNRLAGSFFHLFIFFNLSACI